MNINEDLILRSYPILEKHFHRQFLTAKSETEFSWHNLKYSHSIDVYDFMKELVENDKELINLQGEDKIRLKVAALLHDLGRFYQMKDSRLQKELDHGDMAKKILINEEKFDDEYILLFIKLHEGLLRIEDDDFFNTLNDERKRFARLGLSATEDSDIISNFKLMMKRNTIITFSKKSFNIFVSDEIMDAIIKRRHFNGKILSDSVYDRLMVIFCLVRLLKLDYSKEACNKMGFLKFVFNGVNDVILKTKSMNLASENELHAFYDTLEFIKELFIKDGYEV